MLKLISKYVFMAFASLAFLSTAAATIDTAHAVQSPRAMESVDNEHFPAGATLAQAEQSVLSALSGRGWTITSREPGVATAQYARRDFSVTIRVTYTAETFSIGYVESTGLSYDAAQHKIHPNYNRWIANLRLDILRLSQNAVMGVAPVAH